MKILSLLLVSGFLLPAAASAATAGPGTSGGGGAFVCRNADGSVRDSELVDLWEARNLDGQVVPVSGAGMWQQAQGALERFLPFHPSLVRLVEKNLGLVSRQIFYIPDTIQLSPPSDVNHGYEKPGCPLAGMMYYDGARGRLAIDRKIFEALPSETERAAAMVHEALYKTLREDKYAPGKDSVATRKIVGCLFGSNPVACLGIVPRESAIPAAGELFRCRAESLRMQFLLNVSPAIPRGKKSTWEYTAIMETVKDDSVLNQISARREYEEEDGRARQSNNDGSSWKIGGLANLGFWQLSPDLTGFSPISVLMFEPRQFSRGILVESLSKSTAKASTFFDNQPQEHSLQCTRLR